MFWRELWAKSGQKAGKKKDGAGKKGFIPTLLQVVVLLAGFVAAFVISYIEILFKAVGLRFLS